MRAVLAFIAMMVGLYLLPATDTHRFEAPVGEAAPVGAEAKSTKHKLNYQTHS